MIYTFLLNNILCLIVFRLLSLLAIRPKWLQQLWSAILSASQTSLFGSPTPLLNVIARGIAMTEQETVRIVPLLATFCSLFSLLITTLHDAEFYNDDDVMGMYGLTVSIHFT